MTEFTEKLNSSELVSNAWDEIDRDQASAGLLIDTIGNEFKDWKPPKPLVVVPQFVADAIESIPDYYSAYGAIRLIDMKLTELPLENEDWKYVYDWIFVDDNANKFVKAWLDGYTVEKEQLYKVVFLNTDDDEILLLKSDTFFIDWISIYNDLKYQFTEKEIKSIDERYWPFAVPVEEVEP